MLPIRIRVNFSFKCFYARYKSVDNIVHHHKVSFYEIYRYWNFKKWTQEQIQIQGGIYRGIKTWHLKKKTEKWHMKGSLRPEASYSSKESTCSSEKPFPP